MSESLYPSRSPHIAARKIGREMMIMSARDSTLFSLNEAATLLWEAADGSSSLEEIVAAKICAEFDVEFGEALSDAETFARQLADHCILLLAKEPTAILGANSGGVAYP